MFEELIKRENEILETLQKFIDNKLDFIIIGGYGISAYKHRFSVDADIIIRKEDKEKFEDILIKKKFVKTIMKKLNHVYASEFIRYETKEQLPISIDLLINGVGSRMTGASFSVQELQKYSENINIAGIEKEINARVPQKEILAVLKLHSGRLSDFRDIIALSKDIDIKLIEKFIWRGKINIVKNNIKKLISLIDKKEFIDSFKGVFIEKKYDIDIKKIKELGKI